MLRFGWVSLFGLVLPCVACSAPAPAETSVSLVSEHGLLDAYVRFVTPVLRGNNELFVELRPHAGVGQARLLAVDASMPAHAHEAHADSIDDGADGFHASGLDLFMTGRWQVVLELTLAEQSDSVSLPIDVP